MFGPTAQDGAWSKNIGLAFGVSDTAFFAVFNPSTMTAGTTTGLGIGTTGWMTCGSVAGATTLFSTNVTAFVSQPSDRSRLQTVATESRVVTAAIRATIRYPMSSAPGRLFAVFLEDSDTAVGAMSASSVASLGDVIPLPFDGSGVAQIQCNWRQMGAYDFDIRPGFSTMTPNTILSKCVIVGIGWPGATAYDIECISHIEYASGAAAAGNSDMEPALALTTSIEALGRAVRNVPTVLGKTDLLACQQAALRPLIARTNSGGGRGPVYHESLNLNSDVMTESLGGEAVNLASSGSGDYASTIYDHLPSMNQLERAGRFAASVGGLIVSERVRRAGHLVRV